MDRLNMIPRLEPLCFRHFSQFVREFSAADRQAQLQQETSITAGITPFNSSQANNRKPHSSPPTRIQPKRAAKKNIYYNYHSHNNYKTWQTRNADARMAGARTKALPPPLKDTWTVWQPTLRRKLGYVVRGGDTPPDVEMKSAVPSPSHDQSGLPVRERDPMSFSPEDIKMESPETPSGAILRNDYDMFLKRRDEELDEGREVAEEMNTVPTTGSDMEPVSDSGMDVDVEMTHVLGRVMSAVHQRPADGFDPPPTIWTELQWALAREMVLRPEPNTCIFGPKPWSCGMCRRERGDFTSSRVRFALGPGPGPGPGSDAPTAEMQVEGAAHGSSAPGSDWQNVIVPPQRQIKVAGMTFVVDACGAPMVLRV